MKKIKNITIFSILSICLMLLCGGKVFAASVSSDYGSFSIDQSDVVCVPDSVSSSDDRAVCYYLVKSNVSNSAARGFVLQAYTTNYLTLIGGDTNGLLTGSDGKYANAATTSSVTLDNLTGYTGSCSFETALVKSSTSGDIVDSGCLFVYTTTANGDTPAFIFTDMKSSSYIPTDLSSVEGFSTSFSGYGVVGYLTVSLSEDAPSNIESCGEICVRAWAIRDDDNYANYAGNDATAISDATACDEVHFDTPGTETGDVPETGAFASYAVLVAGALIAISVVAMAKKNSKFNKV